MKLITESNFDTKITNELNESTGEKQWVVEGVFAQQEKANRNRRVYPSAVLEAQIKKYNENFVMTNRAIGELNHPKYIEPNPAMASHRITELWQDGNDHYGKALILNTPQGNIVKGLLEGGTQLGVSTRGAGSLKESKTHRGISEVQNDFMLACVDVVANPSGIDCWVNGIYEGAEWVMSEGVLVKKDINKLHDETKAEIEAAKMDEVKLVQAFTNFLQKISV